MKEYVIGAENAGKRLDKWLLKELPLLPMGMAQKFIRLKRVKLNGKGAQRDTRLSEGDTLQLYISDEFFGKPEPSDPFLQNFHWRLSILYEDENILLADKQPGLVAHPDDHEKVNTLLTHIQAYLYQKKEWDSTDRSQFPPALCNRIDRFTGGIVIAAKNEKALRVMDQKIRSREIEKDYLCIALGRVLPQEGMLDSYIVKEPGRRKVSVLPHGTPSQHALTGYRTLACENGLSLMECSLLTGRTHQIRAQFASIGHPLLGDGQYGDPKANERFGRAYQALYSYRLTFSFKTDADILNYLNGKTFQVKDVPFVREYFPAFRAGRSGNQGHAADRA